MNSRSSDCASSQPTAPNDSRREQENHNAYSKRSQANRLFTREQNREIAIENETLKKRIDAVMTKSRCPKAIFIQKSVTKSSAAINREKKNREIDKINQKIAERIKNAKSTIGK